MQPLSTKHNEISNENRTNHIFIGLMDYRVDYEYTQNSDYGFYIECEDLERCGISLTIYRSIKNISYWKINHLLKRVKPV